MMSGLGPEHVAVRNTLFSTSLDCLSLDRGPGTLVSVTYDSTRGTGFLDSGVGSLPSKQALISLSTMLRSSANTGHKSLHTALVR